MPSQVRSEPVKGMERRVKIRKEFSQAGQKFWPSARTKALARGAAIAVLLAVFIGQLYPQETSFQRKIRLPLWAQLDAYPGLEKPDYDAGVFDYAIRQMKAITPFLLNGMVYGWEFDYTPSDRLRGVPEYFEAKEIRSFEAESKKIFYEQPWFDQSKVHCWANFERDEGMVQSWKQWADIRNPRIMGLGSGKIYRGFDGIQEAAQNALKDAVRNYYRKILKNKPKQITGRVLINKIPAILINSGEYQLQLDFFLETGIIKEYQNF